MFAFACVFGPCLCFSHPLDLADVFAFIFAFAFAAGWLPCLGHGDAILEHGMELEIGRGIDSGIGLKKELKQATWRQYIIIPRYLHAWIPRLLVASFITYALVPKLRYVDAEI